MGVCLGEDAAFDPSNEIVALDVDLRAVLVNLDKFVAKLTDAPLALVLSPFTLCGGEGGGDHLSAFAYAIHSHEALERFAIDKIDGSIDVLLGDGH